MTSDEKFKKARDEAKSKYVDEDDPVSWEGGFQEAGFDNGANWARNYDKAECTDKYEELAMINADLQEDLKLAVEEMQRVVDRDCGCTMPHGCGMYTEAFDIVVESLNETLEKITGH